MHLYYYNQQVPDLETYHAVAFEPLIGNEDAVHHMLLFGCDHDLGTEVGIYPSYYFTFEVTRVTLGWPIAIGFRPSSCVVHFYIFNLLKKFTSLGRLLRFVVWTISRIKIVIIQQSPGLIDGVKYAKRPNFQKSVLLPRKWKQN